jgi:hypothetical protein
MLRVQQHLITQPSKISRCNSYVGLVECWWYQYDSPGQSEAERSLGVIPERPPGGFPVEGKRVGRGRCSAASGVGIGTLRGTGAGDARTDCNGVSPGWNKSAAPAAGGELGPARRAAARPGMVDAGIKGRRHIETLRVFNLSSALSPTKTRLSSRVRLNVAM